VKEFSSSKIVGLPISVANVRHEVKDYSVYVTNAPGGQGVVREIAGWPLELRGEKELIFAQFLQSTQERAAQETTQVQAGVPPAYSQASQKA